MDIQIRSEQFFRLGARTLLGAPGIATSNKCLTSSNKEAIRNY